ncbi:metallophosphoesterase [Methylomagnum ishizawai]|uniref:metallophosphoesterase n=1 Tax=Methylomagnum ishizawai TaxID=1760988 RepID=UPI001C33AC63|nr:metallophosphoesterase [Methylomagnum ishizawai]BBL76622.1 hypothetical protein MishRS11D_37200 [Methylomagnum ishizawai]
MLPPPTAPGSAARPQHPPYRCPPLDPQTQARLRQRVQPCHLSRRLGIEQDCEARVFGQGRTWFHIENWYSAHGLMRHALRLLGLHRRGRANARRIAVRHNDFHLSRLPQAFEGYTLLHISDPHLDLRGDFPDALIDALGRAGRYDLCVLTGDYRARTFGPYQGALAAMARVVPHIHSPIYGILGNHDTIRMVPGLEDLGIHMLLNEAVAVRRDGAAIYLAGIDDPHYYRADNLEKAVEGIPEDAVSILLSHSPEMYRHAAYAGCDAMLSGHTHGGQICLPGGIALLLNANAPRRFCQGPWRYRDLRGYTSAGSGASIVDVRLNCPPEITLHRLRRA